MVLQHPANPRRAQNFQRVAKREVALVVAFAFKSQHRVWPDGHAAIDHSGEMHAQKWHRGVGNGVNQVVNNLVMLRRKAEILTTERADDKARFESEHFHQPVSHQPGTANQRRCFIFAALAGTYHHAVFMLTEAADFGVIDNLAASGLENFAIAAVTSR